MDLFELSATLGLDTSGFGIGITSAMKMITGFTDLAEKKFAWLGNAALDFGKDVIETGLGFDKAMGSVQAVLGREEGTAENMMRLRQFAMEQARQSIFTTEEAADAYYYMGMAGWKTEQMLGGLPGIMALAAASGEDLGLVSDIVTDSMTAFGWSAERASEYADILAATVTNANTDVAQLGQAFKYAAPLAGALGQDVDDLALSFGIMASQGIKGSQAGTTMRSVFQRLATDTQGAATALEDLGIKIFEDGKMRDWGDILNETRKAFAGLNEEQKVALAYQIAGKTGMSGFLALINASEEDVRKLTKALEESEGAAQWMTETRLDNLSGDLEYFNSELNVLKTSIHENVKDPLREVVQEGTEGLHRITDAIQEDGIIGGLKQLTEELRNLKENETFREFLKSAGEAGGEILSIITTDILPGLDDLVVDLGHSLGEGLMGGISDSLKDKYPLLSQFAGIAGHWFGTDTRNGVGSLTSSDMGPLKVPEVHAETITFDGVEFTADQLREALNNVIHDPLWGDQVELAGERVSVDIAQALLESLSDAGEEGGKQMAANINDQINDSAPGISDILSFFIGDGGTVAGALFTTLFGNILNTESWDMADSLANNIGTAGDNAGWDIASGIQSVLNLSSFTVGVTGVINNIVNKAKGLFGWNASAMSSGRIYTKPTVFGYYNNAYQVAGDAGPEAVVGVNSLQRMITSAVHNAGAGQEVVVPRNDSRQLTVIFEIDRQQMGKMVYRLNNEETQRVGVKLAKVVAY